MELFRKLAENFFFKIILAFVILTFVLFGVSGFIFGQNRDYVAKIGDKVITYKDFIEASRSDRELIRNSTNSEEALKYLESNSFKRDVLGRLINKTVSEVLSEEYGFIASEDLILKRIISDKEFQNEAGDFDQSLFDAFLKKHSLDEERYINAIKHEIMNSSVVQTFTITAPINTYQLLELANLDKEKRQVSIIEIKKSRIGRVLNAKEEDLAKYYEDNKESYRQKELREVEILSFSKKDLEKNFEPTEEEIKAKYEEEKHNLAIDEKREFLHIIFDKKEEGDDFINSLQGSKDLNKDFMELSKSKLKKKLSEITLKDITKKGLLPSISGRVFALKVGELSPLLKSELGYHVFLTTKIIESKAVEYSQVRDSIRSDLRKINRENVVENNISKINDIILETNSLDEVIKQVGLKNKIITAKFDDKGKDSQGREVKSIADFGNLANNAFSLDKDNVSKIYYTKDYQGFYIFKIKNIEESRYMDFADVKNQVKTDFIENNKNEELANLAKTIYEEVKKSPENAARIASQNGATYRYKRNFDIDSQEAITNEIFSIKLGESTNPVLGKDGNYEIAILKEIIPGQATSQEFAQKKAKAIQNLRILILRKYDEVISKKYPVLINEKIFEN